MSIQSEFTIEIPHNQLDYKKFFYLGKNISLSESDNDKVRNMVLELNNVPMNNDGVYTFGPAFINGEITPFNEENSNIIGIYGFIDKCKYIPKKPVWLNKAFKETSKKDSLDDYLRASGQILKLMG